MQGLSTALASGNDVKLSLIENISLNQPLNIASGQKVEIDLNGKTLSCAGQNTVVNYGTLKIVNGTIEGKYPVYNTGNITLNCTVTSTHNALSNYGDATMTIEGGTYTSSGSDTHALAVNIPVQGIPATDNAWNVFISGGTFVAHGVAIALANNYYGLNPEGMAVIQNATIDGGTCDLGASAVRNITVTDCTLVNQTVKSISNNPGSYDCIINGYNLNDSNNHYNEVFNQ